MTPPSFSLPWPRSLAGQLIASLLVAITVAQVVSFVVFTSERREDVANARREQVMQRAASLVQMLDRLGTQRDAGLTQTILTAATSTRVRFWIAPTNAVPADREDVVDNDYVHILASRVGADDKRRILVMVADTDDRRLLSLPPFLDRLHREWHGGTGAGETKHPAGTPGRPVGLALSVSLGEGEWLNGEWDSPPPRVWGIRALIAMALMVLAVSAVSFLIVRRLTRPLRELAAAADALGRGDVPPPLTPRGPGEIRRTTAAFNTMQERLHRFVADRTRMLAAISHDLRTPLTSLRLRAEFITDDAENKQKILNILDEMERITEATLAFARDEQAGGQAEPSDITALCGDVAQELGDMGLDVSFTPAGPAVMTCQSTAIKRAIRNLAQNAVHYGGCARLAARLGDSEILVTVEDDGPGIPEADQDSVFEPFTRLETSRSHETGGVGLGLAITRNIVRAHGGDIFLENLTPRGLRVTVSLPLPSDGR